MTYLLAGLAVGRIDLRDRAAGVRLLLGGLALAATAWLVSTVLLATGVATRSTPSRPPAAGPGQRRGGCRTSRPTAPRPPTTGAGCSWPAPHTGTPFDLLHTIGTSLLVLGVCILRHPLGRRTTPHAPALRGRLDDADPLHRARRRARARRSANGATRCTTGRRWSSPSSIAPLWLSRFRRGPLEQVVHAASHDIAAGAVPRRPEPPAVQGTAGRRPDRRDHA